MAGYEKILDDFDVCVKLALENIDTGKEARKNARMLTEVAEMLSAHGKDADAKKLKGWAADFDAIGGAETDETKKLSNRVAGLIASEIMDADEVSRAAQLLEWYRQAYKVPTSAGVRNTGVTTPDFDFAIQAECKDHGWSAKQGMKRGVYWNSIRWECKKHQKEKHTSDVPDSDWQKALDAFKSGEAETVAGAFKLTKV